MRGSGIERKILRVESVEQQYDFDFIFNCIMIHPRMAVHQHSLPRLGNSDALQLLLDAEVNFETPFVVSVMAN